MERLTKRKYGEIVSKEKDDGQIHCSSFCNSCSRGTGDCNYVKEMVEKLAEYEDLEEQGLLLKLPCKIGDKVYYIEDGEICELVVYSYDIRPLQRFALSRYGTRLNFKQFGKTVFLTREEAEKALKKAGGENEN